MFLRKEHTKNSHVDGLFDNDALGGLGRLPPVAEHVVKCFKNTEGYCFDYFEVLQYYFLNTDFSTFTRNADRLAWFQLLTEAVKPTEALSLHCSAPAISNDYDLQLSSVFNGFTSLLFLEACSRWLYLEERNFRDTFTPPASLKPEPIYSPILIRNDFKLELDCENEADEAMHYSSDDKEILKLPVSLLCSFIFRFEKEHYALSKLHNNSNQLKNVMIFKLLFAITFESQKIAMYLNHFALDVLRSYKDKLKQKYSIGGVAHNSWFELADEPIYLFKTT